MPGALSLAFYFCDRDFRMGKREAKRRRRANTLVGPMGTAFPRELGGEAVTAFP